MTIDQWGEKITTGSVETVTVTLRDGTRVSCDFVGLVGMAHGLDVYAGGLPTPDLLAHEREDPSSKPTFLYNRKASAEGALVMLCTLMAAYTAYCEDMTP